ncbi:MAG: MFS transporter, partial [Gammaproteobacteria bacterium]|nr:MFS transporter [Gammaproteobacteria bacterium]
MKAPSIFIVLNFIAVAAVSSCLITPALPLMQAEYHLSHEATVWIVNIFLVGYMLGQLLYGPIANKYGRLNSLRSGLILNLMGIALSGLALWGHSYGWLLISRFVTAIGSSAGLTCTYILINELYDTAMARKALSYAVIVFTVPIVLSVTIGGLITEYWGWKYCFLALAIYGAVLLAMTWLVPEPATARQPDALDPKKLVSNYVKGFKNFKLVAFSCVLSFAGALSYVYATAAPLISDERMHIGPAAFGFWNLVVGAGMLLGGFLAASLTKRFKAETLVHQSGLLFLMTILGFILIGFVHEISALVFFSLCAVQSVARAVYYANAS